MAVYRSIVQTKRLLLFIGVFLCSFYVCLTEMAVTVFIFLQVCTRSGVALGCLPQNVITGSRGIFIYR